MNSTVQSLSGEWMLALDPRDVGREEHWYAFPSPPAARPANVPGLIQETFPARHGVAWYWRRFRPDPLPYPDARSLLRFRAVDYLADVWLNGAYVGRHEGAEFPFTLDVTDVLRPNTENRLVVRVLNPINEPIDGIRLAETPNRTKVVPWEWGRMWNIGGIMQPVELLTVAPVRITDLYVRPEASSGRIAVEATVHNATPELAQGTLALSVASAIGGPTLVNALAGLRPAVAGLRPSHQFPPGDSHLCGELQMDAPRLWSTDDPALYYVTARLHAAAADGDEWTDEQSVRCGFRDFRFQDGYFRLNGRRIFLRSAHRGNMYPIGMGAARGMDLLKRDFYYAKALGFNMVRFIVGAAYPEQLDLCDELGLLVYEESYASWLMEDSSYFAERFDRSTAEMIRRDRNHPCVVIWGLLNETADGPVFRHAVRTFPLVRSLDDTRVVFLSSGRWDGKLSIGSLANPGSLEWECLLGREAPDAPDSALGAGGYVPGAGDVHFYCGVPLSADSVRFLRTLGAESKPVFLSEHGNGSEEDPVRVARLQEQAGCRPDMEDNAAYRSQADRYLADWHRLRLAEVFAAPGDLVREGQRIQSELRLVSLNAIRSNPNLVGYSLTAMGETTFGEGMWTYFRELKPRIAETLQDGWAPLRWCLFAEPVHGYRGQSFHIEAVLANEDVLSPGEYPVCLTIWGPGGRVWTRRTRLQVPRTEPGQEIPFVLPVHIEDVVVDVPAGDYVLTAEFERGAAPAGGQVRFRVSDPGGWPSLDGEAVTFGDEEILAPWLAAHGVRSRPLREAPASSAAAILVGRPEQDPVADELWHELTTRLAAGSWVLFLSPEAFRRGDEALGRLPLAAKGALRRTQAWATGRDDFVRVHPIFEGMPAGGLLDPVYYRGLIPAYTFDLKEEALELVAGAFAIPFFETEGYHCGVHIAIYPFGAGRFMLNTLYVLENLGRQPAADRLLLNMIRYASGQAV